MATSDLFLTQLASYMMPPRDVFEELALSTWEVRLNGNSAHMPQLPSSFDFLHAIHQDDLIERYPECLDLIQTIVDAYSLHRDAQLPPNIEEATIEFSHMAASFDKSRSSDKSVLILTDPDSDPLSFIIANGLRLFHAAWEEMVQYVPTLKHPMAPLVEAWFKLPQRVEPVRKPTGIAPRFAAIRDRRHEHILPEQLPDLPGPQGTLTAYLPGLEPRPQRIIAAPELHLFDYAGGKSMKKGRAAPTSLRLFFELLMSVPLDARDSECRLDVSLRELRDWLYPAVERADGKLRSSYKPSKHLPLIHKGIHEVHNLYVEVTPTGAKAPETWHPIVARSRPLRDLESQTRFLIDLPPGSKRGALIDRRVARVLGLTSALHYRAYISLCYFWDAYGHTKNGKRELQSTRPRVARNSNGLIVNRQGMPMLDRAGKPIERWKQGIPLDIDSRPTNWEHAARELNPEALRRYPVLTDEDLVDLCYSTLDGEIATGNQLIDRRRKAKNALRNMSDQGYIIIAEDVVSPSGDRKGWQILPDRS